MLYDRPKKYKNGLCIDSFNRTINEAADFNNNMQHKLELGYLHEPFFIYRTKNGYCGSVRNESGTM